MESLQVVLMLLAVVAVNTQSPMPFRLNITTRHTLKTCITKDDLPGRCVLTSYCNDNQEIEGGGVIIDNELREPTCVKYLEWCCTEKNVTKPPPPPTREESGATCKVTNEPNCPWCANLYRKDTNFCFDKSGFYCMGTVIGSRVILTTATCTLHVKEQPVWAKIPGSVDPGAIYPVLFKHVHPQYKSGTKEYDLALMVLDRGIEWAANDFQGACISIEPLDFEGKDCLAAGFYQDTVDMTPMTISKGNCDGRGAESQTSCGLALGGFCSVVNGGPVMCRRTDGEPYIVVGMTKAECSSDEEPKALLGNLDLAAAWIKSHLDVLGLTEKDYLQTTV